MVEQPTYRFARRYHWIGFVVLSVLSFPLHFVYEWLGENQPVGYFTPTSESVWEHLKLAFWPTLLWWVIGYFVSKKRENLNPTSWLFASFFSLITAPLIIVSYFYVATAGFKFESLIMDILSLIGGILVGQLLALHVYRYTTRPNKFWFVILLALVVVFGASLIIWTYSPPELPIFISTSEG